MTADFHHLRNLVRQLGTYPVDAYLFILEALQFTQSRLQNNDPYRQANGHVTGPELAHGVRAYAHEQFGLLASVVLRHWGIHTTDDIGTIIFNLIAVGILCPSEHDSREDFHAVFDLHQALLNDYEISSPERPEPWLRTLP